MGYVTYQVDSLEKAWGLALGKIEELALYRAGGRRRGRERGRKGRKGREAGK